MFGLQYFLQGSGIVQFTSLSWLLNRTRNYGFLIEQKGLHLILHTCHWSFQAWVAGKNREQKLEGCLGPWKLNGVVYFPQAFWRSLSISCIKVPSSFWHLLIVPSAAILHGGWPASTPNLNGLVYKLLWNQSGSIAIARQYRKAPFWEVQGLFLHLN